MTEIRFSDEHVDPLLDGEKDVTIRVGEEWSDLRTGTRVRLIDQDGDIFARATVRELEEYRDRVEREEDLHELRDDLRELVLDRYPDVFDVEADERLQELRDRLEAKDGRVDALEDEIERVRTGRTPTTEPDGFDDVLDRLRTDAVQDAVAKATRIKSDNSSQETVWQTLVALARAPDPPVHAREIVGSVGVESETTVGRILAALEDVDLAKSEREGRKKKYRLDRDGIGRVIEAKAEDDRVNQLAGELAGGVDNA